MGVIIRASGAPRAGDSRVCPTRPPVCRPSPTASLHSKAHLHNRLQKRPCPPVAMTTNAPPTVRTRKLLFINSQTTLLSHPLLSPSHSWVTANNGAARASADTHGVHIPQRVVEDVLGALKLLLAKHCRRAYPPQASRNVAEQIESLFMREGRGEDGEPAAVGREVDLGKAGTAPHSALCFSSRAEGANWARRCGLTTPGRPVPHFFFSRR